MHYRIILSKEQQKLLVNKAREKSNLSWILLSKELNCSYGYLLNEIRNSKRTLSENLYKRLCSLAEVDFDKFIIKRINSNWGQIKGANNIKHRKNLFKSKNPVVLCKCSNSLAEIIGIIIGDGSLYVLPKNIFYIMLNPFLKIFLKLNLVPEKLKILLWYIKIVRVLCIH